MLSRPEIASREHIKLWVAGKNPAEAYRWCNSRDCAGGQYSRENIGADYNWMNAPDCPPALTELSHIAEMRDMGADARTFGNLYQELCARGW